MTHLPRPVDHPSMSPCSRGTNGRRSWSGMGESRLQLSLMIIVGEGRNWQTLRCSWPTCWRRTAKLAEVGSFKVPSQVGLTIVTTRAACPRVSFLHHVAGHLISTSGKKNLQRNWSSTHHSTQNTPPPCRPRRKRACRRSHPLSLSLRRRRPLRPPSLLARRTVRC